MGLIDSFYRRQRSRQATNVVTKGQGVPAFWFQRAIEVGSQEVLSEPYKSSVWVQAAIQKIAGPVASVPCCFLKAASGQPGMKRRRPIQDQEIELPEMQQFLRSPMDGLGYADFVEAFVGWMKMAGECFWVLDDSAMVPFPDVRKEMPQVLIARPDRMRHVVENNVLVGWEFRDAQNKSFALLPDQVIQIKRWNPYNHWRGLSEYESASIAAEADWLAGKFSRNLMANNGDTGPYIVAKNGVPTDAQREQILADLRAKRASQQRGDFRPIFLTGDITVEDPQVRSVDAAFINQRLENRHEVFSAFGVPPSMADVKAAYSIGSASDFYQLITTTCIPVGVKFADGLQRLTLKLTGQQVEVELDWDDHPVMQEVRKERFTSIDVLWNKGMPMKDINDALGLELPAFEGWDVGYLPLNVVPVGSQELEAEPEPGQDNMMSEGGPGQDEQDEQDSEPVKEMLAALRGRVDGRAASNKALWEAHMRRRAGTVKLYRSKFNRVLSEYRAVALRKLAEYGQTKRTVEASEVGVVQRSLIDFIFNKHGFSVSLKAGLNPVAQAAMQTAGEQLFEEIGKDDPWKMPPAKALEFVAGRQQSIAGVADTVRSQLNTAIENSIKDGDGIDKMTDGIRSVFNNLSNYEARRIALTETTAAYGFSRDEAMKSAGIEYKGWLSSHGPNVRPAHAQAEMDYRNSPIPVDEPFEVGGEELMYPGDPNGSPENIINCQCVSLAAEAPES